jgi:hypothetical protein
MVCTVDCISEYSCQASAGLFTPEEGAVYTPFVQLTFDTKSGIPQIITVGNQSSPDMNYAAIKSFEYGFEVAGPGIGFKMEIVDTGGIMYKSLIEALNKTISTTLEDMNRCSCKFGWIIANCDGTTRVISNEDYMGKLLFLPIHVKTKFESGVVKISVEGSGHVPRWAAMRLTENFGTQFDKMPLKQAITKLLTETDPKVKAVKFMLADGRDVSGSNEQFFSNSDGGPNGPRSRWLTNQQNALGVIRNWLHNITTVNDYGILICYDPTGPFVVLQEDPNIKACCNGNLGTFIVNGGNCSPVLSFNPEIEWTKSTGPGNGAATGGAATGSGKKVNSELNKTRQTNCGKEDEENTGIQSGPTIQESDWMWALPKDMPKKSANGHAAHTMANSPYSVLGGCDAELKLFGRPDLSDPLALVGTSVSIIVINPFYISENNCTWLTTSNCNQILSNRNWLVLSSNHQISGGSYVTNLRLKLALPNDGLPADATLGCCGNEIFDNSEDKQPSGSS